MWIFKTFIGKKLDAFARQFNYDMAYSHQILQAGLKPFKAFSGLFTLAGYRDRHTPVAPWLAVKWVAVQSEDCGPCQQLIINMARHEGIAPPVIKAITRGDLNGMGPDTALAYQWAQTVIHPGSHRSTSAATTAIENDSHAQDLRQRVTAKWGEQGLISLTLAMAGARSFPMVKRALGHNQQCQILDYGDQ